MQQNNYKLYAFEVRTKPKLEPTRFEARILASARFGGLLPFRVKRVETRVISRRTTVVARNVASSVDTVVRRRAGRTCSSSSSSIQH